ncbi:uncharacterized protein [Ptychodera flava]|uniref:uncharacterized protein n=1 Tax=Ptychodera flava TaxID=63121 RepID=UPI00396A982E
MEAFRACLFSHVFYLLVQVLSVSSVNPDIAITEFAVTEPKGVTYKQDTPTQITFDVTIANEAAVTGDLSGRDDGDNIRLALYLTDNEQFETSTSDRIPQTVEPSDAGFRNAIAAGGSFQTGGSVRANVDVPAKLCGTHNYLCVRAEKVAGANYIEAIGNNNDKCIMFGLQTDGKAGKKQCQLHTDKEESFNGAILTFKDMTVSDKWPQVVTRYRSKVADLVNMYCNYKSNFGICCPGYGCRASTVTRNVVTPDDVRVGRGYPEQSNGNLRVMTLVAPKENNALCELGSSRSRRATGTYDLPQNALVGALADREMDFVYELGYDVVSITASEHLEDPKEPVFESWLIAVIAVCVAISLAAIIAIVYFTLPARERKPSVYIYD